MFRKIYECISMQTSKKNFPLNPLMPKITPLQFPLKLKNH